MNFHSLRSRCFVPALSAAAAWLVVLPPRPAAALDARELVHRVETQYKAGTSHAVATMKIVTSSWTRELKMEMWGRGRDDFLARILAPAKEAGVATLKLGDDMWNYLPRIDKLMKVPSALMGEGWMGSHYTNDDIVKEAKVDQLYTFSVAYEGPDTVAVVAVPKANAAVVWGKIVYVADPHRFVPVRVEYYDEDGTHMRTMSFSDVRQIAGRSVPMKSRIQPLDKPNEYTEFTYEQLQFDVKLDGGLFSLTSLRRR